MDYNRIILELLERIQILESKVKILENQTLEKKAEKDDFSANNLTEKVSVKYRGLTEFLLDSKEKRVCLTYPQLEDILGFELPESAKNHMRQFWANTETHSYASSWLEIGYRTRVNTDNKTVTFEKNI